MYLLPSMFAQTTYESGSAWAPFGGRVRILPETCWFGILSSVWSLPCVSGFVVGWIQSALFKNLREIPSLTQWGICASAGFRQVDTRGIATPRKTDFKKKHIYKLLAGVLLSNQIS